MSELLLTPRSNSGFALFSALIGGQLAPNKLWLSPSWRAKFFLRSMLTPVSSGRHLHQIATCETLQKILPQQPTLPGKIHRPYLHLGLSVSQRVAAIHQHYRFVAQLKRDDLRKGMLSASGCELACFSGKDGENLTINLLCNGRCEREGEVNIVLNCDGTTLGLLTFAINECDGQPQLTIGGLQGAHRETPHEFIRHATKACYGLFPKRILLEALMQLAAAMGITQIYAVRDGGHVFHCLRYRLKKRALFHACYDEFWQSVSATAISRYLYQLPLSLPQKPLAEIASKKRAEYRRRYALLAQLHQQLSRFTR